MPSPRTAPALALVVSLLPAAAGRQEAVDPALRAAVERFFVTQQEENIEAYLALWSAAAARPRPEMLKYVFDAGDDVFSQIEITRVMTIGDRVRVRVSATRQRTERPKPDTLAPVTRSMRMQVSLTFIREGTEWKLLREGPATDDLAQALLESRSAEERAQLLTAEPELLTDRLILSIGRAAGDLAQKGAHAAAQIAYERMLEVARHIKDRKYEAEALQNLGNALYFQRNLPAALDAYEQRFAIERELKNDDGMAAALSGIATIRYTFAEYTAALTTYREALAIQERLGDEALIATTLIGTGNVLYLQGDFDGAIKDYARSRDLSRKILNTVGIARALEGLGRVHLARGDFGAALEAFTGVLEEAVARGDRISQGNATLSLGEAHYRLGNLEFARKTFEDSRNHFEAAKDAANVGRVWQAIALTDLVAARFSLAEEEYVKSRTSCGSVADVECVASATAGLAFAQAAQEKYLDAIKSYRKAIELFSALKRAEPVARTQIGLSHALSGNGDHKAALDVAIEARQTGIARANDDVVWRALVSEARALRRLGQRDTALAAARAAARALDSLGEAARVQPANPVPRDSSSVFATLAVLHAESGDAAAAFEAVERMRAHDLRLGLAGVEREIARGMTDAEREEERSIAVELVTLHAQLAREKALPKPDLARMERFEQRISDASSRRAGQQQRLFARLPELRTWRGLMEPASRSDVVSVLAEGEVFLQFVVEEQDVVLLTARSGEGGVEFSAHVRPVTRKVVAERVAKLTQPEVLRNISEWRRAASAFLVPLVPTDVFEVLAKATRLVVVPHEMLWRVPFEALPSGDRYLGELTHVTYAPSVTAMIRVPARERPPSGPSGTLAAAAPQIADSIRAKMQQTAPDWTLRTPENAASELKAVVRDTPAERIIALIGADATEPAIRERMAGADVIHLALPFRINGASPLFSPVLLSGEPAGNPPDPVNDAKLDARDVMNLNLRASVAVLSDGSAMSMRNAADEAVLVQWAWRAAGVPSLMMPRWAGSSIAGEELLAAFHRRIREGVSAADALRAAQATVRRQESRAAPFHWAGWLLIGER